MKNLQDENKKLKQSKESIEKDYIAQKEILQEKEETVEKIENHIEEVKTKIIELGTIKEKYEKTYKDLPEFNKEDLIREEFEILKNHFEAYEKRMRNSNQELNNLQDMLKIRTEVMVKCEETIKDNNCTLEYFSSKQEKISEVPNSILEEINDKIEDIELELSKVKQELKTK